MKNDVRPGLIVLLGSGETQPSSSKTHEYVVQSLPTNPRIAVLETPAGFELNSDKVAGRIQTFLARRLQNYDARIEVIPARKRGTRYSPDNPEVTAPLYDADEILLGPGSPTYCTRQLKGSLAYDILRSRHRLGAAVFLSSAATISFGAFSIPVYEIYKVGEDPYWTRGLNFFGDNGMNLAVVPHWNNNDGGVELDTSHCYIGRERFEALQNMLPDGVPVLGIDDHTSLIVDVHAGMARVFGNDHVTIIRDGVETVFQGGDEFSLMMLGAIKLPGSEGIPEHIWEESIRRQEKKAQRRAAETEPPEAVMLLLHQREKARQQNDWKKADVLRDSIAAFGWQVMDTPEGARVYPVSSE